jgi:hypothetical protein
VSIPGRCPKHIPFHVFSCQRYSASTIICCSSQHAYELQGRLVPGTSVASLPFIDTIRSKATTVGKDALPDECFARLRGALFLGPSWTVTRNKLKVRCAAASGGGLWREGAPHVLIDRHKADPLAGLRLSCRGTNGIASHVATRAQETVSHHKRALSQAHWLL